MEQIIVKTEVQPNGEILLYYVDQNGEGETQVLHLEEGTDYEIMDATNLEEAVQNTQPLMEPIEEKMVVEEDETKFINNTWTETDQHKLLIFYSDNKKAFVRAPSKSQELWVVLCKTSLIDKTPEACEAELQNLKQKYAEQLSEHRMGYTVTWPLFGLCNDTFRDDRYVKLLIKDEEKPQRVVSMISAPVTENSTNGNVMTVKNMRDADKTSDNRVETMLKLYLRYKNNLQNDSSSRNVWETIAFELGSEGSEYWKKRFMNFKQHYIRMLTKQAIEGPASVAWRYMSLFDEIFGDDTVFQRKYVESNAATGDEDTIIELPADNIWNIAECIILAKYYFDCFDEFQDETIPTNFLWTEVGRLIDKKPEICKTKYDEMYNNHFEKYLEGNYNLLTRSPLEIILDNIISKDVEIELTQNKIRYVDKWSIEESDVLVKFFYANLELFKDTVCYYVCWACISRTLKKNIISCKKQWEELKTLYKSLLNEKMDNPDIQIDWRYIELFDRIFDYGMDSDLLNDFEKKKDKQLTEKLEAQKVKIEINDNGINNGTDDEEFDERGFTKRTKKPYGDSNAFKILEFYQKNKEKFSSQRKKPALWNVLAKQLNITGEQCAHRFRNLKQVYTSYVQREISKPEMPIMWPYYALCKKVFGYRALRTKLKNSQTDAAEVEEWSTREIKHLINYFGIHFDTITSSEDLSVWQDIADEMGKRSSVIKDKFNELRKSYRRLKTVKERNPEYKVGWKFFNLFEEIYERCGSVQNEVVEISDEVYETDNVERLDDVSDEDYECIIVIPEGGDLNDLKEAQIIVKESNKNSNVIEEVVDTVEAKPKPTAWNKKSKKRLLILYFNYVKARKGQEINPKEMWAKIASELPSKTPQSCRKMFTKLKINHMKAKHSEEEDRKKMLYKTILNKILTLKPKFPKTAQNNKDNKTYKDVLLPTNKVELALQYYFQHIEEFMSPKFEKKYLWTELASFVSEPVNKIFNKVNYLKQNYDIEKDEVAGEKTLFSELLKEIVNKENAIKAEIKTSITVTENDDTAWSDDEIEQLLIWYLANLEKFKNPKFVRKYLWLEVASILVKSPLACSKKMTELRSEYKTMIKEKPDELNQWRFYDLCQKIYGTGKKVSLDVSIG